MILTHVHSLPDKICDQISDAVLDAHLKQDPSAKVACGKKRLIPPAGDLSGLSLKPLPVLKSSAQQRAGGFRAWRAPGVVGLAPSLY